MPVSFHFTKKPGGLEFESLSRGSLFLHLPGVSISQQREGEPGQFHGVHNLEGNKLLRERIAIPETKPGRDFTCESPDREDWPNLNCVLAFYCVQDTDVVSRGRSEEARAAAGFLRTWGGTFG